MNYKYIKYVTIILLCIPFSTSAKTYYSDYSDFSQFSSEPIESSELVDVISETRYQGYKERLDYIEEDTPNKTGDVIYKNKRWVKSKPSLILETKKTYTYYEYEDNRKINIVNNNNENLKLKNIYFGENDLDEEVVIKPNEAYTINIADGVSAKEGINFIAYSDNKLLKYTIYIYTDKKENPPVKKIIENSICHETIYPDKLGDIYKEPYELEEKNEILGVVEEENNYLTADVYYLTLLKDYTEQYFKEANEEYKIDLDRKAEFYKFRTKEKLDFKSNLIEDSKTVIDDLIESTTDYKIVSDINYKVNGTYVLNIITPYDTFKEEIVVNNPENVKLLVKNLTENLEVTKQALDQANYQVEVKNQEIKKVITESEDTFLETENQKLKNDLTEVKSIKKDLDTVGVKKSSTIIGIFLMLLLLLVPLLKREKNV